MLPNPMADPAAASTNPQRDPHCSRGAAVCMRLHLRKSRPASKRNGTSARRPDHVRRPSKPAAAESRRGPVKTAADTRFAVFLPRTPPGSSSSMAKRSGAAATRWHCGRSEVQGLLDKLRFRTDSRAWGGNFRRVVPRPKWRRCVSLSIPFGPVRPPSMVPARAGSLPNRAKGRRATVWVDPAHFPRRAFPVVGAATLRHRIVDRPGQIRTGARNVRPVRVRAHQERKGRTTLGTCGPAC